MGKSMRIALVVIALLAGGLGYYAGSARLLTPQRAVAAEECQTFPETGKQVCGRFLEYWRDNGGLAQQGLPLSNTFEEKSAVDSKTYTVQYFERAVFEAHPENQRPYDVLLSLVGREKFLAKYPSGVSGPGPSAAPSPSDGGIIGQTFEFTASNTDYRLRGTVQDVQQGITLTYRGEVQVPSKGKWVAVLMRITNISSKPAAVGPQSFVLKDSQGRGYQIYGVREAIAAQEYFRRNGMFTSIQPQLNDDEVFLFNTPTDAGGFVLVPGVSSFGNP